MHCHHSQRSGKGCAIVALPLVLVLLGHDLLTSPPLDVILGVLAVMAFCGWRIGRRQASAAHEMPAAPESPESPAKYSDRR
jgi:hypothetical protein